MQNAKFLNKDMQHIGRAIGRKMGKIMAKLKHNYNAFPELRIKFFQKQCAIWSFSPSINEFRHKLHTFEISGTILEHLAMKKKS